MRSAYVQRWWYFSTPVSKFLLVIIPVIALMGTLAALPAVSPGIRITAGLVVTISVYALWRGYLHWVEAGPGGVALCTPVGRTSLHWSQIRRVDRYQPPDRNPHTRYVYISRSDQPPAGRHAPSSEVIQLQDREGLLEALQSRWRDAREKARLADDNAPAAQRL